MTKKSTYEELVQKVKELEGELKRVEEELEESEKRFQSLYDTAPLPYQSLDENGCFLDVNSLWVEEFGYSREEVLDQWFGDFLVPEYVDRFKQFFPRFKAAGEIYEVEFEMRRKDGSTIIVSFNGKIVYDSEGRFKQTHCVFQNITALKRAEEALSQSAEKYKGIFNTVPTSIILIDKDGQIVDINPYHLTHIAKGKFPKKEFIGKNIVTHPTIVNAGLSETYKKVLEGEPFDKKNVYFPTLMPGGDGYFNVKGVPLQKNHEVIGSLIMHEDITERKQAEDALRESEENFRELAEKSPLGVVIADEKGDHLYVNKRFAEITGYSIDELIGMNGFEVLTRPEDKRKYIERMEKRMKGEPHKEQYERVLLRKDGTAILTEFFTTKTKWKGEKCPMTIVQDITERKQMEEALRESEKRLRLSLTGSGVSFWEWFPQNGRIHFDDHWARILGYDPGEKDFNFEWWNESTHPDSKPVFERALNDYLEGRKSRYELEYQIQTKTGDWKWIWAAGECVEWDKNRKHVRFLGTHRDITKSKQAAEQTKASLKEKEALLGEIHHRVKNNLQIISSLLDMRVMRTDNKEMIHVFEDTRSKIHTMALIHEQLYRSEKFNEIDISDHIRELVNHLSQVHARRNVSITPHIESSVVYLSITQAIPCALVINELISNAFKHAFKEGQKGTIQISLKKTGLDEISFQVKDDGIGIPKDIDIYTTNSLGFKLLRNTVQDQLMGKMHIERGVGTTIIVEFKILGEEVNHG